MKLDLDDERDERQEDRLRVAGGCAVVALAAALLLSGTAWAIGHAVLVWVRIFNGGR